ncbi:MAG TPA: hypothetical protein VJQ77_07280 [Novosphingobium sp.]|nr:hypothetical protein [Novosphingobium sp.]
MATNKPRHNREDTAAGAGKTAKAGPSADELTRPSPNPHTNLAIADIALRGSTFLARRAVERVLLGRRYAPSKAKAILKGRSMKETVLHTVLARVAMQSVPGAIIIGGGLLAKTLYDRSKARQKKAEGEARLQEMAEKGADS